MRFRQVFKLDCSLLAGNFEELYTQNNREDIKLFLTVGTRLS